MGMDLSGAGGYFRWSGGRWCDILELALAYGWIPVGTGPPRGVRKADWKVGAYFGNDGQRVYARDARELADALERALAAIAEQKPAKRTRGTRATDDGKAKSSARRRSKRAGVATPALDQNEIASIGNFIAFCRAGSFRLF